MPKDEDIATPDGRPQVKMIVGEIAAMEYQGHVKAIAAVLIDKDGDIRTLIAYGQGTKLPLIAGVSILQAETAAQAKEIKKDRE